MPAKKHHYVPVFYQKGFADADLILWRYDRHLREYKHLPPKVICREEDLYAVRAEDGTWDRRIESEVLSPIDNTAADIIRNLAPGTSLDRRQVRDLVMFIGLQHTRLPSFGRAVRQIVETTANAWLLMRFGTLDRAEGALQKLETETGTRQTSAVSMMDAVLNKRIKATANEKVFIKNMFVMANELCRRLEHSEWTILVAPKSTAFIVCDDPFVLVPPEGELLDGIGIGLPGLVYYFPLTKQFCLKAVVSDFTIRYEQIDSRAVRTINHNIAAHSERFVMAASREHLEVVIRRSNSAQMEEAPRYSEKTTRPDENNTFAAFRITPGRYFY